MSDQELKRENCPRLCHLHLTKAESSYGFNLYKRKGDDGQYIGYIDDGSPADLVGLKNGDRLVEVNGENVENKSHKKAVNMIRERDGEVSLLVVDSECYEYFKKNKMKISSNHPDVVILHSNNTKTDNAEIHRSSDDSEREVIPDEDEDLNISDCSDTVIDYTETGVNSISPDSTLSVHSGSEKENDMSSNISSDFDNNKSLALPNTVEEMRNMIMMRKKKDPRNDNNLDIWQKHSIIQAL